MTWLDHLPNQCSHRGDRKPTESRAHDNGLQLCAIKKFALLIRHRRRLPRCESPEPDGAIADYLRVLVVEGLEGGDQFSLQSFVVLKIADLLLFQSRGRRVEPAAISEFTRDLSVMLAQRLFGPVRIDQAQEDGRKEPVHAGFNLEPGDICKPTVKTTRGLERS
jgi:hypothetical protein